MMTKMILTDYLFGIFQEDIETLAFFRTNRVILVPLINTDGYKRINEIIDATGTNPMIRKNRNDKHGGCFDTVVGIDLNRNYATAWGPPGSSAQPCSDIYRGEGPFSEIETRNVKALIEANPNIKMALNFHTYGNLMVTPFGPGGRDNTELKEDHPEAYALYEHFEQGAAKHFPSGLKFGNPTNTVGYTANGGADDWMLFEHGIISCTPELGTSDRQSNTFFPSEGVASTLIHAHLDWTKFYRRMLGAHPVVTIVEAAEISESGPLTMQYTVSIKNMGLTQLENLELDFNLAIDGATVISSVRLNGEGVAMTMKGDDTQTLSLTNMAVPTLGEIQYTVEMTIGETNAADADNDFTEEMHDFFITYNEFPHCCAKTVKHRHFIENKTVVELTE